MQGVGNSLRDLFQQGIDFDVAPGFGGQICQNMLGIVGFAKELAVDPKRRAVGGLASQHQQPEPDGTEAKGLGSPVGRGAAGRAEKVYGHPHQGRPRQPETDPGKAITDALADHELQVHSALHHDDVGEREGEEGEKCQYEKNQGRGHAVERISVGQQGSQNDQEHRGKAHGTARQQYAQPPPAIRRSGGGRFGSQIEKEDRNRNHAGDHLGHVQAYHKRPQRHGPVNVLVPQQNSGAEGQGEHGAGNQKQVFQPGSFALERSALREENAEKHHENRPLGTPECIPGGDEI